MGGATVNPGTGPNAMTPEQMQAWQQTMKQTGMTVTPNDQGGFHTVGQGQIDPIAQSVLSYKGLVDDHHLQMMKDMANGGATVDDLHKAGELGIKAKQTLDKAKEVEAQKQEAIQEKQKATQRTWLDRQLENNDRDRKLTEKQYPGIDGTDEASKEAQKVIPGYNEKI